MGIIVTSPAQIKVIKFTFSTIDFLDCVANPIEFGLFYNDPNFKNFIPLTFALDTGSLLRIDNLSFLEITNTTNNSTIATFTTVGDQLQYNTNFTFALNSAGVQQHKSNDRYLLRGIDNGSPLTAGGVGDNIYLYMLYFNY